MLAGFNIAGAQDTIWLSNSSFESDRTACFQTPTDWASVGKAKILPSIEPGCHVVDQAAADGDVFVSLVTRADGSWQGLSSKLPEGQWLHRDSTYRLSLFMAHDPDMTLPTGKKDQVKRYEKPAILRVWGFNARENRDELLAESPVVAHEDWRQYDLLLSPWGGDYDQLDLEVYYTPLEPNPQRGNILLDNIQPLIKIGQAFQTLEFTETLNLSLRNSSFEGEPGCCSVPMYWYNCGAEQESPPDIQPGSFQNTKPAVHGNTYLGLVIRDNNTTEGLGQHLPVPLMAGRLYLLQTLMARASTYISLSRVTGEEVNYASPAVLRVWAGDSYCAKRELLAESPLITSTEWMRYTLPLRPKNGDYTYLTLEAYYKMPRQFPYNGNLLLDDCSLLITK